MASTNEVRIIITAKDEAAKVFAGLSKDITSMTSQAEGDMKKMSNSVNNYTEKMSSKTAAVMGAVVGVISSITQKGIQIITSSIGDAISRVDTLNNAARTFANMGFDALDTSKAMDKLKTSILGLPTALDSAVSNMQILAASVNDVSLGQKIFSSLNDAILGFGGTTDMVKNATIQLSQAFSNGKIDGMTWISMMNSGLGPVLNAIAREMGITTGALKEGLAEGSISVKTFQDALIKLDAEGGGGMKSLQQIAKDSTAGIATGWTNAKTAITRGLASIVESIGAANISGAIKKIGDSVESALKTVSKAISDSIKFYQENKQWIDGIVVSLGAMVGAMIAIKSVLAIKDQIDQFRELAKAIKLGKEAVELLGTTTGLAAKAQAVFNAVANMNPIGIIVTLIAGLVAGFIYFWNTSKEFRGFFIGMWDAIQKAVGAVVDWFKGAWNTVSQAFGAVGEGIKSAWQSVSDFIKGIVDAIVGFFKGIIDVIVGVFNGIVEFLKQWGITILAVMFLPISLIVGLFFKFKDQIFAVFQAIWDFIVMIFTPVVEFFGALFQGAIDLIVGIWNTLVGFFQGVWNGIVGVFSVVGSWFSGVFTTAWNGIKTAFGVVGDFFKGVWNGIVGIFNPIVSFFSDVFKKAWEGIKSVFSGVGSFFKGVFDGIVGIFNKVGSVVADAISKPLKAAVNTVIGLVEGIVNGVVGAINIAIDILNYIPGVKIGKLEKAKFGRLAAGTSYAEGGSYITGENGPELVNLPKGSEVIPAGRTAQMQREGSINNSRSNTFNISIENRTELDMTKLVSDLGYMVSQA